MGLWKASRNRWEIFKCRSHSIVDNEMRIKFWKNGVEKVLWRLFSDAFLCKC